MTERRAAGGVPPDWNFRHMRIGFSHGMASLRAILHDINAIFVGGLTDMVRENSEKRFDWPESAIATLQHDWCENKMSAAEIGIKLGCSKNAVVGKVHRLGLLAKPSPIKRRADGVVKVKPVRARTSSVTLVALSSMQALPELAVPVQTDAQAMVARAPAAPATAPQRPIPPFRPRISCQFVTNKERPFLFCSATSLPGRVYCAAHYEVCYERKLLRPIQAVA
jgi:GcrA cell cycle regulator